MEGQAHHWWTEWAKPQVLIALLVGILGGAQFLYHRGSEDMNLNRNVQELKEQVASLQANVATKDTIASLPDRFASKESVTVLQAKFESYQLYLSDKLNTFGAQLNNVEKLAGEAARRGK